MNGLAARVPAGDVRPHGPRAGAANRRDPAPGRPAAPATRNPGAKRACPAPGSEAQYRQTVRRPHRAPPPGRMKIPI